MLEKLKSKWKVTTTQLLIILCTFALGGSLCGIAAKKLLSFFPIENNVISIIVYIVLVTLLWPICVILISIPLGQFPFFSNYLKKMKRRIFGKK
jgi:hypothetical protein